MMRVALYLRYSSKKQKKESLADQERAGRDYTGRMIKGGVVHIYADAERTGKTVRGRDQYQQMLIDATSRAHPYDAIVIFHVDRLARRMADAADAYDRLHHAGVELHSVCHGKLDPMVLGILAAMAQAQSAATSVHTHKALDGHVRDGKNAGGIAYGYRVSTSHFTNDGKVEAGHLEIDPEQASIVVRAYEEFANGDSPEKIVRRLNAAGIAGPRGEWLNTTLRGNAKRETGLLRNRLYIGERVWDRCEYRMSPDGNRDARPNPKEEWLVVPAPELRIIRQELWDRVQARFAEIAAKRSAAADKGDNILGAAHRNVFLLSGLLRCCDCGGSYTIVGKDRYGCATRRMKGMCDNSRTIKRQTIEERVLIGLKHRLLEPDALSAFVESLEAELKVRLGDAERDHKDQVKQKKEVEKKIAGMMTAIQNGLFTQTMKAAMEGLESQKLRLDSLLSQPVARPPTKLLSMPDLPDLFRRKVAALESLLDHEETKAEAMDRIRSLIDHVDLQPLHDGGMAAELHGELAGILAQSEEARLDGSKRASGVDVSQLSVVAGAGFEPAAFRL